MIEHTPPQQRLLSLDAMRGLIMVLLMAESTRLFDHLINVTDGTFLHGVFLQFTHHEWHGLRFWDLIQPGFMFIAGTAMAFSLTRQQREGLEWGESFIKSFIRSGWLFFWGVLDYAVRPGGLSFELWDVLTQLSFTCFLTFLIFRWPVLAQVAVSVGLLIATELLYRFGGIRGYDQPFTDQHNVGNFLDLVLMGKVNDGGWVAINCIPTAAHTIWGALAGKLLLSAKAPSEKIKWLVGAGVVALLIGYTMDATITPIIKRIATSSFVFASGGWCLLALAGFYWWIDVSNHRKHLHFLMVVSLNSLFIYLFFEIVGGRWFNDYIGAITNGLMSVIGIPELVMGIVTSLVIFFLEWNLCSFLYRKNIFFRI